MFGHGIPCRKDSVEGKGTFLHSFRDHRRASKEEADFLRRNADGYDLDMEPKEIYDAYSRRWEIETVMRYYKQACEFVSFLSSLLTYRILNDAEKKKVLENYTYGQMMERLRRAKKIRIDGSGFRLIRVNPSTEKLLCDLRITEKEQPAKRKVGRPKKETA